MKKMKSGTVLSDLKSDDLGLVLSCLEEIADDCFVESFKRGKKTLSVYCSAIS